MSEKVTFSSSLSTRLRGTPNFEPDEAQFKAELARKYRQLPHGTLFQSRVHPAIEKFCASYWDEQAQRLQFETKQSYDACSREIARREPWVYLCRGATGDFEKYDIDIAGDQGDDE